MSECPSAYHGGPEDPYSCYEREMAEDARVEATVQARLRSQPPPSLSEIARLARYALALRLTVVVVDRIYRDKKSVPAWVHKMMRWIGGPWVPKR